MYLTITPVNDCPLARDDDTLLAEDTSAHALVLLNDSDIDSTVLTVTISIPPVRGVAGTDLQSIYYTPTADYNGTDSLTYSLSDGQCSVTATVLFTVTPLNDCPVAVGDSANLAEDTSYAIAVLANDGDVDADVLTVTLVIAPAHGLAGTDGTLVYYTPTANYAGVDSLAYGLSDGSCTVTATVCLTVTSVNDCPVAHDDSATTLEDRPVGVRVLINDSDVDGDVLTATLSIGPAHGSAGTDGRTVYYTPTQDYSGSDALTYSATDGTCSVTATLRLTVTR